MSVAVGAGVGLAAVAGLLLGPREKAVLDADFDEARLDGGVDAYLRAAEAAVPDLRQGVAKRVHWAGVSEQRTAWSVVYVHGFSATSEELRPLPDLVAQGLGANLHFTRLSGHGRSGEAMAEPRVQDWMTDVAEALAIGRRIGRRVLVMGCSTGCTLLTLALARPMAAEVAGAVLIAPNYRVRDRKAVLTTAPWARHWLPLLAGRERGFVPSSEAHGRYWTARYPSVALLPMGAAVKAVNAMDHGSIKQPAMFVFDDRDALVDHDRTREIAARWGGAARVHAVQTGPTDDPGHHVIAGDVLSPAMTAPLAEDILRWCAGLMTENGGRAEQAAAV